MAEYCSQCSPFGEADYNLTKMAIQLKRGHSFNFLCEGCSNKAIYKDNEGQLWVYQIQQGSSELKPIPTTLIKLLFKK